METQESAPSRGTTDEFAKTKHVKSQTVLKRLCNTGSYFGVKPVEKLENGRWVWELRPTNERSK